MGVDDLNDSAPRSESVSSSHSAASTKMDKGVAVTQDFTSGPALKEKNMHDERTCSTSSGRLPLPEQGRTSEAYGVDLNVPSSLMQEDLSQSSRNRLGAKRPHEFSGREKNEEDALHRPKRSQRVA